MTANRAQTATALRNRLLAGGLLLAAVLVGVWTLPLAQWLEATASWIAVHPILGRAGLLVALGVGTVVLIPGSVLAISSGYLLGFAGGFAVALVGTTAGASLAFLAGRSFARPLVADAISGNLRFAALDSALDQRGFFLVILTRLSLLLPFNLLNYVFGLTKIALAPYALGTLVGMVPALMLYVYLGTLANDIDEIVSGAAGGGVPGVAITVIGVVSLALAVYLIHRTATAELKKYLPEDDT